MSDADLLKAIRKIVREEVRTIVREEVRAQIRLLELRIAKLESRVDTIETRLEHIETTLNLMNRRLLGIENRLSDFVTYKELKSLFKTNNLNFSI